MASKQAKKTAAQVFAKRAGVNRQIDALLKSAPRENPAGWKEAGIFTNLDAPKNARTRVFKHAADDWALSHGFPFRLISRHVGVEGSPIKFGKTRAYVAIDEDEHGKPVVETWKISGLQIWGDNPAGSRPLDAPRKNPVRPTVTDRKKQLPDFRYLVQIEGTGGAGDWFSEAAFRLLSRAEDYAKQLHRQHPTVSVRVLARD